MLRKLLIIASAFLTFAFVIPAAHATVDCQTSGNGVTCFGGQYFCPANNSCYSEPAPSGNPDGTWSCGSCGYVCSGTCNNLAGCYTAAENGAVKVGQYAGSCSAQACPSNRTLCAANANCRLNSENTCPQGTTWNPCDNSCGTPYILQNPTAAQSVSNNITFTGNTTVNGNENVKGMFSLGATSLNVGVGQNGMYQVVAGGSSGSLMLLQTFSGASYTDRFRVDASGNVTAPAFVGNGSGLTSVIAGDIVAGTHSNAVTFDSALNSFTGNFTATGGNKFNGDGTGLTGVCLTTGTGCPSSSATWTRTGTNVALTNIGDNVGVGIATPAYKLDVYGEAPGNAANIHTRGDVLLGVNSTLFFDNNYSYAGGNYIRSYNPNVMTLNTAGAERVRVDAAGNVGIGTNNPQSKLEVAGKVTIDNSGTAVGDNSPFVFETAADTQNGGTTALYIYPRDSANHRVFFGKPGLPVFSLNLANVGGWESFPGNISPIGDFTVYTNYGNDIYLRHSAPNGSFIFPAVASDDLNSFGYFHFKSNQNDVGAGAQAVVLDTTLNRTGGNLLDVRNNGISKFSVGFNGNTNVVGNLTVTGSVTAGGSGMISGGGTIGRVPKFTGVSAVGNSVIFDDGSNIGIGTTTPTQKLDVTGSVNVKSTGSIAIDTSSGSAATGLVGSGSTYGVIGAAGSLATAVGVYGNNVNAGNNGTGVYGENSGGVASSYGVQGRHSNSAAYAGYFLNTGNSKSAQFGGPFAGNFTGDVQVTGNLASTTFSGIGTNLTALNASNLASGTVGTARLGTGTANATTFLRGDSTWAAASFTDTDTLQTVVARGNTTNTYIGVNGAAANAGYGVASQGSNGGVYGTTATTQAAMVAGVVGVNTSGTTGYGVYGSSAGNGGVGLYGTGGNGVIGNATFATGGGGFFTNSGAGAVSAMLATQQGGINYAGYFQGNTYVNGNQTITGSLTAGSITVSSCSGCGGLSGGVANTIPKWTGASTQGSSQITDDGTLLGIGGASGAAKFAIQTAAQQEALYAANTYVADATTIKFGVYGSVATTEPNSAGVYGSGPRIGVEGYSTGSANSKGVYGYTTSGYGVVGQGANSTSSGGYFANGGNSTSAQLATQVSGANYAGYFTGDGYFTGNVGLGIAPSYKLDVNGVMRVSGSITSGPMGVNGQAPTAGWGITAGGTSYGGVFYGGTYGLYGSGSSYSFYGGGGTLYNSGTMSTGGDLQAESNSWGSSGVWHYCPTGAAGWNYCVCEAGTFVGQVAFQGTQAATLCYKP